MEALLQAAEPGAIDNHDSDFARYRRFEGELGVRKRDVHRIAAVLLRRRRTSYAAFTYASMRNFSE
ncbi:hypothetical protein [Noviluteimonas gilva]|uniref:Uncharacterized protein n=1 Tax=Noviluteimonas gilva TaxID=2682097 RepID=A0A7C9HKH9_9GAMM|nr:hypothetical protein [Lysobacter gilvus]MUV12955.1 hypothetical protein [Lysobacter gilvus]